MKSLLLTSALLILITGARSQSQVNNIKKGNATDSTKPNISTQKKGPQTMAVPLLPDIAFDEFPINHNEHITTDGTYYYTINGGNFSTGQINKFDLSGNLLQTYPILIDGRGLSYNKADGFLYASLYAKSIVRIDNLALGTFTTIFAVGMQNDQASFAISNDGTKYFDFYAGTLLVHDFFTGAVINTINGLAFGAGNFGGDAAVAVDSLYIYTWDASIKTVTKYDMTGNLMQTVILDSGDNGMSLSRAGNYLFVSRDGNYAIGTWYGYLVDSIFSISASSTCIGDSTAFSLSTTLNLLGAQWNFGDTASGLNNVAYIFNPMHLYTQPGTYTVELIRYFATYNDTSYLTVTIDSIPNINLGTDTSFCDGSTYQINAGSGFSGYMWQDGSTDSTYTANAAGTFYVIVYNGTCAATDTIVLSTNPCAFPIANFYSSDTSFCEKQCIDFTDISSNNPISWQWFFPGADSTTSTLQNPTNICYNTYGSFDVTLITCNAVGCDTLFFTNFISEYQAPLPVITQSNDTLYAPPGFNYQWYTAGNGIITGATDDYYVALTAANYFVLVTDSNGCEGSSNVISITTGIDLLGYDYMQPIIFPNPSNGNFEITFNQTVLNFSLRISNSLGEVIRTQKGSLTNQNSIIVTMSNANVGIYFLELETDKEKWFKKIVIYQSK